LEALFSKIKEAIIIVSKDKHLGDLQTLNIVLDYTNDDVKLAVKFLTSKFGGFTKGEANKLVWKKSYNKMYVKNKKKKGMKI